jgi:hypothetical protein
VECEEALRREIHDGLQVIENWNSANDFIFFGKGGEIATNRLEDQEVAMLSLHLLQISLVYINTLMIQQVLTDQAWWERMKPDDLRALTPLIYAHINPYGRFDLDMQKRLHCICSHDTGHMWEVSFPQQVLAGLMRL